MASTYTSDLNSLFATIYEKSLLVMRSANVMPNTVTVYRDMTGANTRNISQRGSVTAAAVAENADLPSTAFGKSSLANLTPAEVGARIDLSDRAVRTDPNIADAAAQELGAAMGQKIDKDIAALFTSFTGGSLGGAGTANSWGLWLAAAERLRAAGVPGPYYGVMHNYQWFKLAGDVSLVKNLASTPDAIKDELARKWYVGSYGDIHFIATPHITIDGLDDAIGGVYHPQAIGFDVRQAPKLAPQRDESLRTTELNMVADYAVGVQRPAFGVKITTDATAPTGIA